MSNFPYLDQIPAHNIVTILAKMNLPESSKMLQTCRFVKDTVELPKKRPAFFVEQITLLQCEMMCTEYVSPLEVDDYLQRQLRCSEKARKSLRMDNVIMEGYGDFDYVARIEKSRLKCNRLVVEHGIVEDGVLPHLYTASGASSMWVTYSFEGIDPIPKGVSFDIATQLATMGCKDLVISYCDELSYDSPDTFARFQLVHMPTTEHMDINFSIIPLVKQMITSPSMSLRYFWLPVYDRDSIIWEFKEMGLEKWILSDGDHIESYSDYLIETEEDYIILAIDFVCSRGSCISHRFSKKEKPDDVVIEWFETHTNALIPFDASGLYELFLQGDLKRIQKYLRNIVKNKDFRIKLP